MKKILLFILLLSATLSIKAQFTAGWDKAMNFGGAGADVEEMRYVNGDLYFFARMMGKYQFAGTTYDAGAFGSYPDQDLIFGKISATGTQTLLRRFESVELSAITGGARIGADGSLYVLRLGLGTSQTIGSLTTPTYGVQLLKVDANGQPGLVKKLNTFSDIEFGSSGVASPNLYAMQVKDNGDIYTILKSNTARGSVYAARVIKLDNVGNEVWHYEMTAASAGTSLGGIIVDGMPRQFVDDAGNLTFKVGTSSDMLFNGETLPYEEPYSYAGQSTLRNWIISLNSNGAKKWNTSAYVSPTFYGVNPQSGDIYINYSYGKQNPAVPASIAPFSSLPNLAPPPPFSYIPAIYSWSGIITLNTSGGIVKTKANYANATAYPAQMQMANNGRIVLFSATANGTILRAGENFISFDGPGYAAMEVDADFNPLKVFRLPSGTVMALNNNNFAFGGPFKNSTTVGSTTLTANYIDTDFNTRFPAWGSIKTDVLIAEGRLDNIPTELVSTTWLGTSTNWNDAANWSNGVPTSETKVIFNTTTTNMPTVATSPKAGQLVVNTGVEVSLPTTLTVLDKVTNNGKINIAQAAYSSFTGYGAKAVEGSGELAFSGPNINYSTIVIENSAAITGTTSNTVSFDNTFTLGTNVSKLKFNGPNAKITSSVKVTSPDEDAISGYSSTNFIIGKLTRKVNPTGNYFFPVGGYSEYAPVTLKTNALAGATEITVELSSNNAGIPSIAVESANIGSTLGSGFWKLLPNSKPTGGSFDITLEKRVYTNGFADANRYLSIKRDTTGQTWSYEGVLAASTQTGATITGDVAKNGVVNVNQTGLTKFGEFTIGISSLPLTPGLAVTSSNWTGAANTSWDNVANWSNGVPDGTVDAIIPAGLTNYPLVYTTAKSVRSLEIASGVTVNLSNLITVNTSIINNGIIEINSTANSTSALPVVGIDVNGHGKVVIKTGRLNSSGFSTTGGNLGVLKNDLEVNIGNTSHINILGKFDGNVNIISGLVFSKNSGSNWFNQTNPLKTVQVAGPVNHIAGRIFKSVSANGTYNFPIGDDRASNDLGRKNGEITIAHTNINQVSQYQVWFDSQSTEEVSLSHGNDVITSFINSGQWNIIPNAVATSGTLDVTFKTSNFTNGRVNVGDYVLLRKNYSGSWSVVNDAVITQNAGEITASATGLAPFTNATYITKFCIGIKATTTTWTGATSGNWTTAGNWSNGVPSNTVKAIFGSVNAGATVVPTTDIPTYSGFPAAVEVQVGATLKLPTTFYTNIPVLNNGSIEVIGSGIFYGFGSGSTFNIPTGSGTLKFTSNSPETIDGYYFGSNVPNSIEVSRNLNLYRTTNFTGSITLTSGIVTVASGQTFNMTNPDATISGSATSYINGFLKRNINASGTYAFPVGTSTAYTPATIKLNNIIGPTNISASFSNSAISGQPNLTVGSVAVSKVLDGGSWTISPNSSLTAGSYDISLAAPKGSSTTTEFVVLKRPDNSSSSSAWTAPGSNQTSSVTGTVVNASATGITSFSQFAIGEKTTTLPVKLIKFIAKAENNSILLHWETATELNNDKFIIERSTDGIQFSPIGEIDGKGNSNQIEAYKFVDYNPLNGHNYYRLNQIDLDSESTYSNIESVNFSSANIGVLVFPNPFISSLNFTGIIAKSAQVALLNQVGKEVFRGMLTNNNINIPSYLPDGIYIVKIIADGKILMSRQVIKK